MTGPSLCQPMTATTSAQTVTAEEHRVIWLEPGCVDEDGEDRHWCQDDAWGPCDECGRAPVKYIIASEVDRLTSSLAAAEARIVKLETKLREIAEHPAKSAPGANPSYAIGWAFWNVQSIARGALSQTEEVKR